jgi:hypothetical protein
VLSDLYLENSIPMSASVPPFEVVFDDVDGDDQVFEVPTAIIHPYTTELEREVEFWKTHAKKLENEQGVFYKTHVLRMMERYWGVCSLLITGIILIPFSV